VTLKTAEYVDVAKCVGPAPLGTGSQLILDLPAPVEPAGGASDDVYPATLKFRVFWCRFVCSFAERQQPALNGRDWEARWIMV